MGGGQGLEVREVSVVYPGGVCAVDRVSLEVVPGSVLALLGPSGCGKSSLLRAVAGLEDVAGGRVLFDEEDVTTVAVHRRGFGLMFQDGQLFPFRDVAGNVAYGLVHLPRRERAERVAEVLELVGLPGYERRAVDTLSGGQAQRVALARSLAPKPRLLLLDEPLSALDRALREELVSELRHILTSQGMTALYVTHDHGEAAAIADQVGVMSQGHLVALGSWETVRAQAPGARVIA